jgi:hypothetical protein
VSSGYFTHTQSHGAHGIWLADEKRVLNFDEDNQRHLKERTTKELHDIPRVASVPMDKRMLALKQQWQAREIDEFQS